MVTENDNNNNNDNNIFYINRKYVITWSGYKRLNGANNKLRFYSKKRSF